MLTSHGRHEGETQHHVVIILRSGHLVQLSQGTDVAWGSNMGVPEEAMAERPEKATGQILIGCSVKYRVFLEFIGIPVEKVNARIVREELNKSCGSLSTYAPSRGDTRARDHLWPRQDRKS